MSINRHRQIEEWLNQNGECSVESLAQKFQVSEMTIRRDLMVLAKTGRIIRTHGGAMPGEKVLFEFQFLQRSLLNQDEKEEIAAVASQFVYEGQSVMMDSGTTTLALARRLCKKNNITIVTSSLPIAAVTQNCPGLRVLLLGGYLRMDSPDLFGVLTETNIQNLTADIAFIGADGIDLKGNIYNASPEVASMLTKMTMAAQQVYVIADHSKVGRTALVRFGNISKWNGLITDKGLTPSQAFAMRNSGIRLFQPVQI